MVAVAGDAYGEPLADWFAGTVVFLEVDKVFAVAALTDAHALGFTTETVDVFDVDDTLADGNCWRVGTGGAWLYGADVVLVDAVAITWNGVG